MNKILGSIFVLAISIPTLADAASIRYPAPELNNYGLQVMDSRLSHNDAAILPTYLAKCKKIEDKKAAFTCVIRQQIRAYDKIFEITHLSYPKAVREYSNLVIAAYSPNENTAMDANVDLQRMNAIWHQYLQIGMKCGNFKECGPWAVKNKYLYKLTATQEKAFARISKEQAKKKQGQ